MAHIMMININHLRSKQYTLTEYTCQTSPDVLLINETHLKPTMLSTRIQGYKTAARMDGDNGTGGVAIYCRDNLSFSTINTPSHFQNTAAILISIPSIGELAVITHYIPPYPTSHITNSIFHHFTSRYRHCLFMGDYNAHHPFINSTPPNSRGNQLYSILQASQLDLINAGGSPTFIATGRGISRLLDLAIATSSAAGHIRDLWVGDDVGSDHLPVHITFQGPSPTSYPIRTERNLRKANWDLFKSHFDSILSTFQPSLITRSSIADEVVDFLHEAIEISLEKACPARPIKKRDFVVSRETLKLIKQTRRARRLMQRNPGAIIFRTVYKDLKRKVATAIKEEKSSQWKSACESLDHRNATAFWRQFHRLSGSSGERKPQRVNLPNGDQTCTDLSTSDAFANHLNRVHQTNQGPLYDQQHFTRVTNFIRENRRIFTPQFAVDDEPGDEHVLLQRLSPQELLKILSKCKNTSPGEDGIGYSILKQLPTSGLRFISRFFHFLLQIGYFPTLWKSAIGVMIPKASKDPLIPGNNRPISLIRCLGKLLEKTISSKLIHHLSSTGQLNPWQRAYLPKKEANEHLHRLALEAKTAVTNGWTTGAIFLDVEKAFDSVWQDGLRYKVGQLDIPVKVKRFLSSYLSDRTISVRVGVSISTPVQLAAGTPQGSVLSPILFNIYVNDLPFSNTGDGVQVSQYADDLALWFSCRTFKSNRQRSYTVIQRELQTALHKLESWCSTWRIKLNAAKTQFLFFTSQSTRPIPTLTLFNTNIQLSVSEVSFLGGKFREKSLSMIHHCMAKRAEAERRINLLRRLRGTDWGCSSEALLHLYKTFIRPVLETGYPVTVHAAKTAIRHLQIAQNKALRVALKIFYVPGERRVSTEELHRRANLEMIEDRLRYLHSKSLHRFRDSPLIPHLDHRIDRIRRLPYPFSRVRNR